jgi:outer membrane lipoprotein carrier protein
VRVGFASDGQLAALDILDSFGQRSLIRFTQLQTQASLPASTFEFKVPAGADVLKQ